MKEQLSRADLLLFLPRNNPYTKGKHHYNMFTLTVLTTINTYAADVEFESLV